MIEIIKKKIFCSTKPLVGGSKSWRQQWIKSFI